jgi:GNAT superfamily N-acetyltransferase
MLSLCLPSQLASGVRRKRSIIATLLVLRILFLSALLEEVDGIRGGWLCASLHSECAARNVNPRYTSAMTSSLVADIRPATPADRDAVVALLVEQMREHDIPLDAIGVGEAVDGALARPDRAAILVARPLDPGAAVIGVAYLAFAWTLEHGGLSCWLEELYVSPPHRERGTGSALLRKAIDHARAAGCAAMDLEVEESHDRAKNLYLREGFRAHTRRRFVQKLA